MHQCTSADKHALPNTELQERRLSSGPTPDPFIISNDSCSSRYEPNMSDYPKQIAPKMNFLSALQECTENDSDVCVVITNVAIINETTHTELNRTDSSIISDY